MILKEKKSMPLDRERLMQVLERAHNGPVTDTFDWDAKIIPSMVNKHLKANNLQKTCDNDNPINCDDELADRFFNAGLDMAVDTGLLCLDTHRIIKFSRDEILNALESAPAEFPLGTGKDKIVFKTRG